MLPMASIFSRILDGELPGRFLWTDPRAVALLDVRPLHPGHALVIPRAEVDQWTDLEPELAAHLMTVAHHLAGAQRAVIPCSRVGLLIAGFEVPHVHLHVIPVDGMGDFDFSRAETNPDQAELDRVAQRLRDELRRAGHGDHVPS
jgi:diadenosine tetraphosphate (Ap4A) HIT family hydrolase